MTTHGEHYAAVVSAFEAHASLLPETTLAEEFVRAAVEYLAISYWELSLMHPAFDNSTCRTDEERAAITAGIALDSVIDNSEDVDWHWLQVQDLNLTEEEKALVADDLASGTDYALRSIMMIVVNHRYAEQVAAILLEMLPMMRSRAAEDPRHLKLLAEKYEAYQYLYDWRKIHR
ncbi:hypothetical protein [Noviherbaspirillum aerium]|uniref:hypothetical protein n=1 Tax=Noviherbaspirillum aerium TaxID=2588497 RepID=UPI00124EB410|nr:hypothetical protein [Noviherbaspirillum aerium]